MAAERLFGVELRCQRAVMPRNGHPAWLGLFERLRCDVELQGGASGCFDRKNRTGGRFDFECLGSAFRRRVSANFTSAFCASDVRWREKYQELGSQALPGARFSLCTGIYLVPLAIDFADPTAG